MHADVFPQVQLRDGDLGKEERRGSSLAVAAKWAEQRLGDSAPVPTLEFEADTLLSQGVSGNSGYNRYAPHNDI